MGIFKSRSPIATVNRQCCSTEVELQRKLRQVVSKKRDSVEIAIHEPSAQRVFLSLAMYSPAELLPHGVDRVVEDLYLDSSKAKKRMDRPTQNLGLSLAVTEMMNHAQSPTAMVVGSAVLSAINQGYGKVSFGTTHQGFSQDERTGAVLISMKA